MISNEEIIKPYIQEHEWNERDFELVSKEDALKAMTQAQIEILMSVDEEIPNNIIKLKDWEEDLEATKKWYYQTVAHKTIINTIEKLKEGG